MIQGGTGDGAVVWVFSAIKLRQSAHPEHRCRFWKRVRLRLGARDYEGGVLMQIDVHIPLDLVVSVLIVVEADDHVWQMTRLVVAVVGGVVPVFQGPPRIVTTAHVSGGVPTSADGMADGIAIVTLKHNCWDRSTPGGRQLW